MKFHESIGVLRYSFDTGHKLIVEVDQEISNFYRSLIPKFYSTNRPRYPAHITVVRSVKESPTNLEFWGKYEGEEINFVYSPIIHQDDVYFWLNAFCNKLEDIRSELGLSAVSQWTLPPSGFRRCFHITIANQK